MKNDINNIKKYKYNFLWNNFFHSYFFIFILFLITVFLSKVIFDTYLKYQITKKDFQFFEKENIEKNNKLLEEEEKLKEINSDFGKEKYIREIYGLKKPEEKTIIIYNDEEYTQEIPKTDNFVDKVIFYFKKIFN